MLKLLKARLEYLLGKDCQGEFIGHQKFYAKLVKRYYGPLQVPKRIDEMTYRLRLADHWHIHNAFHVSLLKLYKGNPPCSPPIKDPPKFEDD